MPDGNRNTVPEEPNPAQLEQLIDLDLMQKRDSWRRAAEKRRMFRLGAYFFLLFVLAGAACVFFLFFK